MTERCALVCNISNSSIVSTDAAGKNGEAAANGKEDKSVGAESKPKDDGLSFERETVAPLSVHEVSLLDKILKGSSVALGPKPVMMSGAEGSAVLHLTIYLPTRTEMMIDVRSYTASVCVAPPVLKQRS